MTAIDYPAHTYSGGLALIRLHERHLRSWTDTWHKAKAAGLQLPETKDRDYQSLDHLQFHVLACARGYMVWMCEKLEFADPGIRECPAVERIAHEADDYLAHVLEVWSRALVDLEEERSYRPSHETRWGTPAKRCAARASRARCAPWCGGRACAGCTAG